MKKDIPFKYREIAKQRGLVYNGYHLPYLKQNVFHARMLKTHLTQSEKRIKGFLDSQGIDYAYQHPIDYYIVDFYFPQVKLVLEIDGEQHYSEEGKEYDALRDTVLRTYDLRILRIRNAELGEDFNKVCRKILLYIENPHVE